MSHDYVFVVAGVHVTLPIYRFHLCVLLLNQPIYVIYIFVIAVQYAVSAAPQNKDPLSKIESIQYGLYMKDNLV